MVQYFLVDEERRLEVLTLGLQSFPFRNQQLFSHSIRLGSFLPLELHIMGRELNFGSHNWK